MDELKYSRHGPKVQGHGHIPKSYGSLGTSFPLYLVFVVGTGGLVVTRELEYAGGDWGKAAAPILWVVVPTLMLGVALFSIAAVWASRSAARRRTIQGAQPDALVLLSGRVPQLIRALDSSGYPDKFEFNTDHLPLALCLVANEDGMEVWGGTPMEPFEYLYLGWDRVIDVAPTQVQELGRWSRGLLVSVTSSDGSHTVDLPFVILGRGFAGLFPESEATVAGVVARVRALKSADTQ